MNASSLPLAFLLFASAGGASFGEAKRQQDHSPVRVNGVLVLHWEYSIFIRTDGDTQRVFEIEIRDSRWLVKNRSLMMLNPTSMGEYLCVRGRGYEDRGKLGATGRSTFIFTEILDSTKVGSEDECRISKRRR
jgi:hypothetical protein